MTKAARKSRHNPRPKVSLTIHGVFFKGRSVLLVETKKGWTLPGGRIESQQSARKALKMELREETGPGWKVKERRLCAVYVELGRRGLPTRVMFIATGLHSGAEPSARGEVKKVEWCSLAKAKRRLSRRDSPRWKFALQDSRAAPPVFRFLEHSASATAKRGS